MTATLMMHCNDGKKVDESRVRSVDAPEGTDTWCPIPHYQLLDEVQEVMSEKGMIIDPTSKQFGLKRGNNQMFAVFKIIAESDSDFGLSVGIRNSIDKSLSAALCFGSHVFVCDNLAFSGEESLARKHTKNILDDLRMLIGDALDKANVFKSFQTRLYAELAQYEISDTVAHDLMIRAFKNDAIPVSRISHVLSEWEKPSYPEFEPRTAWSLFNAFTESAKVGFARNPQTASQRTMKLTRLMQSVFAPHLTKKVESVVVSPVEDAVVVPKWLTIS